MNNKEISTKSVAVRAVEPPMGAFCKEFRREKLCDEDFFVIVVRFMIFLEKGRRESCGALDLTSVRMTTIFRIDVKMLISTPPRE